MLISHMCRKPERESCSGLQVEPRLGDKEHGYREGFMRKPALDTLRGPLEVG